ncbi:peptidyl-tRNA hydrolase, chloroplastic-like isoform X3 [Hibiscus syriacus]|uniref:peptidyl-tRNA hydrolase, chloroplastic-like isoform X3 n=1 Tax=Hibiscus syriacus TaxID=106335 RepID=UPI001922E3F6|nr:peptidyl-tRNA hydrolase, chloroplastic-like isoform X3 [Hibiscus syriacus]
MMMMMKLNSSIPIFRFLNFNSPFIKSYCPFKFSAATRRTMTQFPNFSIKNSKISPTHTAEDSPLSEPENKSQSPPHKPWLIVGLGNRGKKFNGTRHNVGFMMVDAIAEAEGISVNTANFKALIGEGFIGNVPVMLAEPQTFMNASGRGPHLILQDSIEASTCDLPFAKLRLLPKGGHGGHNGMRSIIDSLKGSRDFPRLRIGIGRPQGRMDTINYVLRPFDKQEREELEFTFQQGIEAVRILLLEGFDKSATFVNSIKAIEQLR